jgi:hypothetical protein
MKKLLMITAVLALIAPAAASSQRTKTYKTEVVLKNVNNVPKAKRGTNYFHGKVKSDKPACARTREVILERDGSATGLSDETDEKGRFDIQIELFIPGTYKVLAPAFELQSGDTCKQDRSKPFVREAR